MQFVDFLFTAACISETHWQYTYLCYVVDLFFNLTFRFQLFVSSGQLWFNLRETFGLDAVPHIIIKPRQFVLLQLIVETQDS